MLYKLNESNPTKQILEPCKSIDMRSIGKKEKDLEDLLAELLLENLFEQDNLMPIFQERAMQPEADLVALDEKGNVIIFELKRSGVSADAVPQIIKYFQKIGRYDYDELNEKLFEKYKHKHSSFSRHTSLLEAHQEFFELPEPLDKYDFNKNQYLYLVGTSTDKETISFVDFWKSKGLNIDFTPYRIYNIEGGKYLEFFAKPYDMLLLSNGSGIIVDTNRAYLSEAATDMIMSDRAICSGADTCDNIDKIKDENYVFLYHRGIGIIAAGKVAKKAKRDSTYKPSYYPDDITKTIEVKWDIKPTIDGKTATGPSLCASEIKRLLPRIKPGYRFRGTTKLYLSKEESEIIIDALKKKTPNNYLI